MDKNQTTQIGVVILNYSTFEDTIRLVGELQHQSTREQLQIIVVDNCSPNDAYAQLKPLEARFDNVTVLQTGENLGYAKGNNYGLHYLDKHVQPEYVAILNNDVILPNDCLERLMARYEELERPAIIAPMMTDPKGVEHHVFGNLGSTWDDFKSLFSLYNKISNLMKKDMPDYTGQKNLKREVLVGCFLFARFSIFKEIGFFYPNTFLYVEERFVAEAAKRHGYYNYVILDQRYIHSNSSPTIAAFHNQLSTIKLLYASRLEYIRVCKKYGKVKALIFKPFMCWSLLEWRIIGFFRSFMRNL